MQRLIKHYISVTKPRIILGNMISTAGGFLVASKGRLDFTLLVSTILGTSLVVASGCVFNNYIDRTMDRKMIRTRNRPLARGLITQKSAAVYGASLGTAGAVMLWTATSMLCIGIVLAGFVIYVCLYSKYLKRRSVYGTLVGSLAGAAPPLVGYCTVGNHFDMGAIILLSIFILWQVPHSYAIAIYRFEDFAVAAIPILPVKQGVFSAKNHLIGHISAFVAAAPLMTFCGYTGYRYLTVVAALGLFWLRLAWSGYRTRDNRRWARQLYILSIVNIFALSVMMSIDYTAPAASGLLLTCVP